MPDNRLSLAVGAQLVVDGEVWSVARRLSLQRIMLKRLHHTGSTLRSRSVADKAALARAVEEEVWPLIEAGKFRPVMDRTFQLRDAAAAHARMESSAHIGKIVLTI